MYLFKSFMKIHLKKTTNITFNMLNKHNCTWKVEYFNRIVVNSYSYVLIMDILSIVFKLASKLVLGWMIVFECILKVFKRNVRYIEHRDD